MQLILTTTITLESSLDSKEIQPVHPKGNQPWIFIGRTDDEAEAPILWPPDAKSQLIGKDPDAGKEWGWEEKGEAEEEIFGQHHWFNGHESEQTPRDSGGQRSLACYRPWGPKESDMTEQLNWTEGIWNLPGLGIEPVSLTLAGRFFNHWVTREALYVFIIIIIEV